MAAKHPFAVAGIMFSLAFASLALGAVFGASRVLGKYWAPEIYLTILGGTYVNLTLSDRQRIERAPTDVSSDDSGVLERSRALSPQIGDQMRLDDLKWTNVVAQGLDSARSSNFPSGHGVFKDNVLYLSGELKGRLHGEEMDPLVASSLIFQWLKKRKNYL